MPKQIWIEDLGDPSPCWIWSGAPAKPDSWVAFRRTFTLADRPAMAPAIIAAETKYWLWVNGALVVREGGLKRGPTPEDGYADQIDLAPWLRPGRNTIAVLAWHLGHDGASHCDSGSGGLLVAIDAGRTRIVSDRCWRAQPHPAFDTTGIRQPGPLALALAGNGHFRSDQGGVSPTLSEWSVRFDARRDLIDWTQPDTDDLAWPQAVELGRPPESPWGRLAPRPIPFWRDSAERPYIDLSQPLPCVGPVRVVGRLPANLQVLPTAVIDGEPGSELVIAIERDFKTTTWVARGGSENVVVLAWGNGECVTYDVPAGMRLEAVGWRETGYAADEAGSFISSDPGLDRLWRKTARSVHLNMRDSWSDCPDRERSPWPGDTANAIAFSACTLSPSWLLLAAKTLREFAAWATPAGNLWGAVPTGRFRGTFREFPAQSMALLALGLPEYLMQSGDLELVRGIWPVVRRYLLELHELDKDGFVCHRGADEIAWGPGVQCWYDWGPGIDQPLLDQGWYALAMVRAGEAARRIGADEDAECCHGRFTRVAAAVQNTLWDPSKAAFIGRPGPPDERGNALLILAGVPDRTQQRAIATWMSTQDIASMYMERHVLEALCEADCCAAAVARIHRRYASVISDRSTTLPEAFGAQGNHAWGGAPALITARHLCGIRPLEPGWRRYRVAPDPATPERFTIRLATLSGCVGLVSERRHDSWSLTLDVPSGCSAAVDMPARWRMDGLCELGEGRHSILATRTS